MPMKLITLTLTSLLTFTAIANNNIIPKGNGAWVYDQTYNAQGTPLMPKAGLFVDAIKQYNAGAGDEHTINQVFSYGGNLEMYCAGSGESDPGTECGPNQFLVLFYPPQNISKKNNNWDFYMRNMGDSGYTSLEQYKSIKQSHHVIDIDGRVDNAKLGIYDYLDHLNTLNQTDAAHFADKVAKNMCANDDIDGVQFDIEPFSFTGKGGTFTGPGQKYFYTQLAKDFAGYYARSDDPAGVNPNTISDPLHCVSTKHPNGRFFSVFTFSKYVTADVVTAFKHHDNGMIVDSLYDLSSQPGGTLTTVSEFSTLVSAELQAIKSKDVPYQFAIPAAASAHEFESINGKATGQLQLDYVKAAIGAINQAGIRNDPNFKGIDLWSWNQQMEWNGLKLTPEAPNTATIEYLQNNL